MISAIQEKFKSKKLSAKELTQHYLKRIKADKTNSYITVSEEAALKQAEDADRKLAIGREVTPLTGIPIALKDLFCTTGIRTTCASKILGDYTPPYDATVVKALKQAGAVLIGKLNMDEFAMGGSNENSAYGHVKNSVNPEYVPGGSSGGSASSVKSGLAVGSLGTDTGGSIRLPASYSGIVGLKPTYGRVSRFGVVAFSSSLDQVGPMTTSVEDNAYLLNVLAGHDVFDSTTVPQPKMDFAQGLKSFSGKKLKIGLPKEYFVSGLQAEVASRVDEVKKSLEKSGHTLVPVSLPHTQYSVAVYYIVAVCEASSNLARFDGTRFGARATGDDAKSLIDMYKKTRALFGEEVKRRIVLGTYALSAGYYDAYYKKACQVRRLIKQDFDKVFTQVDAIIAPVAPTTAFKIGEKMADPLQMYLNDIFTIPTNLAGLPGISVPCGRDSKGMPIGVQFIGKAFDEATILGLAHHVEQNVYKEEVNHGI